MSIPNDLNKINKQSNFFLDFIIAGVSAAFAKTATAPLERVKLILQNQILIKQIGDPYKGIFDCYNRIIKAEGFLSLWRGNIPNVLRYFPNQALNFAFKDTFKTKFCKYDPNKDMLKYAIGSCFSGGLAGSVSLFLVHPIDLIRTRLATDNIKINGSRNFSGATDCACKIYRASGIKGLYKGIVVSIIGIFTYRAAYFGGYDSLKSKLKPDSSFFFKWAVAQFVTVFSGVMFYPLDTIRRRVMIESGKPENEMMYKNARDCVRKVYRQETYFGFYKGFAINAFRTMGSSIILVLYDDFQKLLGYNPRSPTVSM